MKEVKPVYGEDYNKLYSTPDYKDKTVLDIGANHGSTAYFFLSKGASKVIGVESNEKYYKEFCNSIEPNDGVEAIHMNVDNIEKMEDLLVSIQPDILHADCEGCEEYLVGLPDKVFMIPTTYQLEIHNKDVHTKLRYKLIRLGYKILKNDMWTKNIWITVGKRGDM